MKNFATFTALLDSQDCEILKAFLFNTFPLNKQIEEDFLKKFTAEVWAALWQIRHDEFFANFVKHRPAKSASITINYDALRNEMVIYIYSADFSVDRATGMLSVYC